MPWRQGIFISICGQNGCARLWRLDGDEACFELATIFAVGDADMKKWTGVYAGFAGSYLLMN
jgi:hypothetical protein